MKTLLLASIALYSVAGLSMTKTITPTMLLENGFEFESVKVTNICQQADGSFKTINPASNKCVKYARNFRSSNDYLDAQNGCARFGSLDLFGPESKTKGECVAWGREDGEYGCTQIAYHQVQLPLTYEIKKVSLKREQGGDGDLVIDRVLSSWTHTIPSCE